LEGRLYGLKYGSHAFISFVYFSYVFLSLFCGWKWTIWEARAVVKGKRAGAHGDFRCHRSKNWILDPGLDPYASVALRSPRVVSTERENHKPSSFRLVANQFFVIAAD
jgi:hypothetical protein